MIEDDNKNVHGFLSRSSGLHDFLLTPSCALLGDLTACTPEKVSGSDKLDSLNTLVWSVAFNDFREVMIKLTLVINMGGEKCDHCFLTLGMTFQDEYFKRI